MPRTNTYQTMHTYFVASDDDMRRIAASVRRDPTRSVVAQYNGVAYTFLHDLQDFSIWKDSNGLRVILSA